MIDASFSSPPPPGPPRPGAAVGEAGRQRCHLRKELLDALDAAVDPRPGDGAVAVAAEFFAVAAEFAAADDHVFVLHRALVPKETRRPRRDAVIPPMADLVPYGDHRQAPGRPGLPRKP
ncbi:hypothetical protein [Couchioplanes caeruleus]|uniref:Uncharacterized protein n=2 Tax=Couchioplanes caeruleus TaxID=56438 RepID=A0A1K0GXE8_9ACTN|nr:hypothetical protein [Couchioplanes caeruleus]OJF14107.1 hypothetical protein BG844_11490 [Couchioplanes caeruleus subsp. caeruleus]ROP30196.1 hypothetical protein EDD30_3032 [Couchioplanes caeruleus]